MHHPIPESVYRVPFDGSFELESVSQTPPEDAPEKSALKDELKALTQEMYDLQRVLYADNRYALLLVFQAMDAAGKDSTIRAVMTGVNPAGCQVFSFQAPSEKELDHDFLWRTTRCLPERGRIGIFNRSYYEEVLVVRVHPELLEKQRLPQSNPETIWKERFESIVAHEKHLTRNGTVILKFFLNVSPNAQKERFLKRIRRPDKHWKFSSHDCQERAHWEAYMEAYQEALRETSKPWAPWYAIPADDKPYMRSAVAKIIVDTLKGLDLDYPSITEAEEKALDDARKELISSVK